MISYLMNGLTLKIMTYLKYRHTFSSGESTWDYKMLEDYMDPDSDEFEEIIGGLEEAYSWSDKYRGVEHEIIDRPPQEWLDREIKKTENSILRLNKYKRELTSDLAEIVSE